MESGMQAHEAGLGPFLGEGTMLKSMCILIVMFCGWVQACKEGICPWILQHLPNNNIQTST